MDLLLKILGGVTLTVIVVVGLGVLYFVWKMRGLVKSLGQSFPTPNTVSLQADPDAAWTREAAAAAGLAELVDTHGWVRGPVYTIPEMPGVSLVALHHPGCGAHGCYYNHPTAGHWVDFCATLADGTELTVGNPPMGSEMDTRPGTRKLMRPGESLAALQALLLQELAGQALQPYRPEDFVTEFQQAYAKDMAWRTAKGGTSEEEFLRIAANQKQSFTDEQLRDAFRETKAQEIQGWSSGAIDAFGKTTTLTVAEWKKYEGNMFILREDFHAHGFLDYLDGILNLEENEVGRYRDALDGGISLRGLLDRIAADTGHAFTKLGEVDHPKPTAIYGVTFAPEPAD